MSKHFLKRVCAVCTGAVMSLGSVMMNGSVIPTGVIAADGDNYAKLLQYSLYLYDANMCGDMSDCAIEWRGNCHMQDDVVGGFHDAGDHVMFGQPQGYAASTLGWAYYEFKDAFEKTGQAEHLKVITDRFAKFFRDATKMNGDTVSQVLIEKGEGGQDHMYWGAPEQQGNRGRMLWTTGGAANITAEYAAALAANYVNFGNPDDLKYAKALYNFSKQNPGYYACDFYDGHWTGSDDELNWAAGWLYLATRDESYKNDLSRAGQSYSVHSWESVQLGAGILKGEITGDWGSTGFLDSLSGDGYCFAADSWKWGSARYNTTGQMCKLVAAKYQKADAAWAKGQMQYITGDRAFANGQSHCLVVGFKDNSSRNPHHRAASPNADASEQNDGTPNQYLLVGALCGGPMDANGTYYDKRSDYTGNEVALDYNAGFVGAAAGLYHFYGTGSIETSIPGVKKIYNGSASGPDQTTASSDSGQPGSTTTTISTGGSEGGNTVSFSKASDVDNNPKWVVQTGGASKLIFRLKTNSSDTEANGNFEINGTSTKWEASPSGGEMTVECEIPSGVSQMYITVWWPTSATLEEVTAVGGVQTSSSSSSTEKTTTTTSTSTTTTLTEDTTPPPNNLLGDVDCDGKVRVADAILLARYIAEDDVFVSAQGKANAELGGNTKTLTTDDLIALLQMLAGL